MNQQIILLLSRAVIRLLNSEKAEFELLIMLAKEELDRDRHLYITVQEQLEAKAGRRYEVHRYRCEICGAYLDPGEVCDCKQAGEGIRVLRRKEKAEDENKKYCSHLQKGKMDRVV